MNAYEDTAPELADVDPADDWGTVTTQSLLQRMATAHGDVSGLLTKEERTTLAHQCVEDYEADKASLGDWETKVKEAISDAAQDEPESKTFPWPDAANVKYPFLPIAGAQFAARAYPALAKGDTAVGVKVLGEKPTEPKAPPQLAQLQAQAQPQQGQSPQQLDPQVQQQLQDLQQQAQAAQQRFMQATDKWAAKNARAKRVRDYLNYQIFYRMEDWEGELDVLLNHLPITGMAFKKVYYDANKKCTVSQYIHPLHLTVAMETKNLQTCPRVTHDFEMYPYEIIERQKQGVYLADDDSFITDLDELKQEPRCILEQHRLHDLDGDGIAEPYIITVDQKSNVLLRIEAAFGGEDIEYVQGDAAGISAGAEGQVGAAVDDGHARQVRAIRRTVPFVKFPFLRDPKGRFYEIGFGHLLAPISSVINASINQLLDAQTAQAAGGGWAASGVRMQGAGQSASIIYRPGVYQTINIPGNDLRNGLVEKTLPNVSPITFQLLELMLGAAKEIASVKDVLTGDAPTTAPVGTTQMLIEQGLQSFTAIYKRVYNSERAEYRMIYECEKRYGDRDAYREFFDGDPDADMDADFESDGEDIVPVSDPSVVTNMQALAKAQMAMQIAESPIGMAAGLDPKDTVARVYQAAQLDDPVFAAPQPNPELQAKVALMAAQSTLANAQAQLAQVQAIGLHATAQQTEANTGKLQADTIKTQAETIALHATTQKTEAQTAQHNAQATALHVGTQIEAHRAIGAIPDPANPYDGRLSDMAGTASDALGVPSDAIPSGDPAAAVESGQLGSEPAGPDSTGGTEGEG